MSETEQTNTPALTETKTLQDMEKNNLKEVLEERTKTETSYMIVYIILAIIAILGLVGYFYFRG